MMWQILNEPWWELIDISLAYCVHLAVLISELTWQFVLIYMVYMQCGWGNPSYDLSAYFPKFNVKCERKILQPKFMSIVRLVPIRNTLRGVPVVVVSNTSDHNSVISEFEL